MKITNIEINEKNINKIVNKINYPARKIAHYIVYFILGMLIYSVLISFNLPKKSIILVIVICFIYSITDEYHQTFSLGRTAKFTDCIIDTFGSICGSLIILYRLNKKKNINE